MGTGKTYSTKYLLDSNNSSGVAGQVLSTTSTGIDWADANTLPGSGLWLESGNDIYNSNSGNVGIGTTSPNNKLDVNGDVFINSNYTANVAAQDLTIGKTTTGDHGLTIVTGNANTASIFFGDNNNNDAGMLKYQHSSNSMQFVTNRSERMRIDSAGNVGIGVTGPVLKLMELI